MNKLSNYYYWVIRPIIWKYIEEPILENNWSFYKKLLKL